MTDPAPVTISTAQDTPYAQRLLAAQARLYSDAKRLHGLRVLTVFALTLATVVAALAVPDARTPIGTIGGVVTFMWSVLGSGRERWIRKQAASIQEEFDTHVFEIPWNTMAAEHPSPTVIAGAAARYRGNRTEGWYPDTGAVARPLDVLICQRSNLGWGAALHRIYSQVLTGLLCVLLLAALAVALIADLSALEIVTSLLVPILAPARELVDMIRDNRDSASTKANAEVKVHRLWEGGLKENGSVSVTDCRAVQDQILSIRQSNAHVPDWFDNLRRDHSEDVMHLSAQHLVDEAVEAGKIR